MAPYLQVSCHLGRITFASTVASKPIWAWPALCCSESCEMFYRAKNALACELLKYVPLRGRDEPLVS